jgi:hypothetical protein
MAAPWQPQVMELVEGGELFDHIVQMGSFTEPVARYVPWWIMVVTACHVSVVSETAPNIFWGVPSMRLPQNGLYSGKSMKILLKWMNMDDLGVPPILGNLHMEKI